MWRCWGLGGRRGRKGDAGGRTQAEPRSDPDYFPPSGPPLHPALLGAGVAPPPDLSCVPSQALTLDLGALLHLSDTMATGADVRDILELGGPEGDAASGTISKKDIINPDKVAGVA